ncbi:unnamed protein product [Haemonchus placei]|uniref:Reverse transcriptase domain-containing protein n=1 Tax=Haemonchus placei TaxID=6290 RepID=A0A0N4WRW8_HAEPC|nr:unnamed protein product [Haemonchus placei]
MINVTRGIGIAIPFRPNLSVHTSYITDHFNLSYHASFGMGRLGSGGRWPLHYVRFADDIMFITPNIKQAAEFDSACGKIGLTEPNGIDVHGKRNGSECSFKA